MAAAINQNLAGIRASVTGTGLSDDPWLITAGDQSLTTGMPVTYQDSWNLPNLGMTHRQTCYVVVQAEQAVPQTLIVGLAATSPDYSWTRGARPPGRGVVSRRLPAVLRAHRSLGDRDGEFQRCRGSGGYCQIGS